LLENEPTIDDIASINLLDVEYLKAWGFIKALRQAFQTPKGLAYVIFEQYKDSTGPPIRLEDIKHRNKIQGDPNRIEKPFFTCGQDGIKTKYSVDAQNSIYKIFFYDTQIFFMIDSFDEDVGLSIAQLICDVITGFRSPPPEPSPEVSIAAPADLIALPNKNTEFTYSVTNLGPFLKNLTIEVRSSDPNKISIRQGAKSSNVNLRNGEDWQGRASVVVYPEDVARYRLYVFVNTSLGETLEYQSIDIEVLPIKLDFLVPKELFLLPNPASFDFSVKNLGREIDSLSIKAVFKTTPNPGYAYVKPAVSVREFKTNSEVTGEITLQINNFSAVPQPLYIQAMDGTGKILEETAVQIIYENKKSPIDEQTFIELDLIPDSLWMIPDEIQSFSVHLVNVGDSLASNIRLYDVRSEDGNWVEVLGEEDIQVDSLSGRQTKEYRKLSKQASISLRVGESHEKIIFLKAGQVGENNIYISVSGDNFPSLEESFFVQVSPKGTPRTEDEEISLLFDPGRAERVIFKEMAKEVMYKWEGGKLYYEDCTYIPLYGPSCDTQVEPDDVIYVYPDLSKRNSRFDDLGRIYGGILTAGRDSKSDLAKTTFGLVEANVGNLQVAGAVNEVNNVEEESGDLGLANMAKFLLGPIASAYSLVENLRERNLNLKALERFFPGAEYGYIHHNRKKDGKWDSVYSKAFFVKDPASDVYYVYVLEEPLQ